MSAWGAFIGLLVSIFLIIRKVSPVYSLILGALVGGLLGGVSLPETISLMISGVNDVTPAVIRILTAGVLSGILVKTGAAASISNTIIYRLGERHVFFALAFATMLLTAIGVFIDVAVITVAPIALSIGRKLAVPRGSLLLMMIGGGKCGNIISPNPNTIIAAENFHADLQLKWLNVPSWRSIRFFRIGEVVKILVGMGEEGTVETFDYGDGWQSYLVSYMILLDEVGRGHMDTEITVRSSRWRREWPYVSACV